MGLRSVAAGNDNPDLVPACGLGDPLEVAAGEKQEVGGHDRRGLEAHLLEPTAKRRVAAAGMLLTAISVAGTRAVRSNAAL